MLGFAIERERSFPDGRIQRIVLNNRTGFDKDKPKPGDQRPSTVWPFQRFWWADHHREHGSSRASAQNDENFVILRDNPDLALEYAAHILSVYHHYRWIAYVHEQRQRSRNPQAHLRESDTWQQPHFKGEAKREPDFWVR